MPAAVRGGAQAADTGRGGAFGQLGELFRREGLDSSRLTTCRKPRYAGVLGALTPSRRASRGKISDWGHRTQESNEATRRSARTVAIAPQIRHHAQANTRWRQVILSLPIALTTRPARLSSGTRGLRLRSRWAASAGAAGAGVERASECSEVAQRIAVGCIGDRGP